MEVFFSSQFNSKALKMKRQWKKQRNLFVKWCMIIYFGPINAREKISPWCLWNVGKLLPDYTAQQPRRQPYSYSPPRESEISRRNNLHARIKHSWERMQLYDDVLHHSHFSSILWIIKSKQLLWPDMKQKLVAPETWNGFWCKSFWK
jgi:hypothetical protein